LGVLLDLANASAIVTGGAVGFGSATERRLAQKGAKAVIADVTDERGEALAREAGSGSLSRCRPIAHDRGRRARGRADRGVAPSRDMKET
jgi:NAD(P)-dependent dehydrogenase (short-subunit alcohol dehydrogenase family)